MQYWKTHQKDLILKELTLAFKQNVHFTIWQQQEGHRHSYLAKFSEVSRKNCHIKIIEPTPEYFNPDAPFYAHLKQQDILFKRENYHYYMGGLDFAMPGEIQIFEKRKHRRFSYLYQDHKNITFESTHKNENNDPLFTTSSVLVDISTQGAGMVVNASVVGDLAVDQSLYLRNLTDQELPEPFKVKVVYIEPYKYKQDKLFKVGIIFDDQLDSISYKSISSIIEIKQKKIDGLNPKRYCGLDNEEQLKIINQVEINNKVLANNIKDNIEYLDQLRYMTTQMKVGFLKQINQDLLAVALRLSSKELVYELFSEVTVNMQDEFLDKLERERPASAVCKAQDEIIAEIRQMVSSGEVVLDPKAFVTYV